MPLMRFTRRYQKRIRSSDSNRIHRTCVKETGKHVCGSGSDEHAYNTRFAQNISKCRRLELFPRRIVRKSLSVTSKSFWKNKIKKKSSTPRQSTVIKSETMQILQNKPKRQNLQHNRLTAA